MNNIPAVYNSDCVKFCKPCGVNHPLTYEFWSLRSGGLHGYTCRQNRARTRASYSAETKRKATQANKERRQANPELYAKYRKSYRSNATARYHAMKYSASIRGHEVDMTKEEYTTIYDKPCHYCYNVDLGIGYRLDRKDNDKGYTLSNVVPCCKRCNLTRGANYTYEQFVTFIAPAIREMDKQCQITM